MKGRLLVMAGAAPRKRHRPRSPHTVARRQARERAAFARSVVPVLARLEAAGVCANGDQAERLNALGIPSETGRPWELQTVAALKYRLLCLGALPPQLGRLLPFRRTKRRL